MAALPRRWRTNFVEVVAAQPELIAHHYGEAGLNEKAVEYWLRAGQQAVARSAMAEAVAHLKKGLELTATMPSSRQHQVQELDLRLALSAALSATKGYSSPQVAETFSRISELAEQVDEPTRLFPVLYGQWAYHLVRSEHRVALSFAERIEQRGELQNDVTLSLLGHFYHGICRYWLGEFAAAHALFERCRDLRDPAVRNAISRMIPEDAYAAMLGYSSMVLAYLGYFDQAQSRADEGLLEPRRLRHAYTLAYALNFKMTALRNVHMEHEIRTYADELFDLSNEHGFPIFAAFATQFRGTWSVAVGQARQGATLIAQAMDQMRATGAAIVTPRYLAGLAEAFARLGDPAEGLGKLREAAQFIEKTDQRCDEGQVRWLQGELLSASGDKAAAELNYRQALAVAGRQKAKAIELRAAMSMARLWRDQGKREEANELLAPVYGWFTEGFDTLDLKEARALLEELK
jgi:predicted ATPase